MERLCTRVVYIETHKADMNSNGVAMALESVHFQNVSLTEDDCLSGRQKLFVVAPYGALLNRPDNVCRPGPRHTTPDIVLASTMRANQSEKPRSPSNQDVWLLHAMMHRNFRYRRGAKY